jgi:hypothetical protein
MLVEKQKKTISDLLQEKEKLTSTIFDMKEEVTLLNSKLENMTKYVKMLKKGSDILDETLEVGKRPRDMKGIWFDNNIIKKNKSVPKKKFLRRKFPQRRKLRNKCLTTCPSIRSNISAKSQIRCLNILLN